MVKQHIVFGILVILLTWFSFFLIPNDEELLLMHLKEKEYAVARNLYEGILLKGKLSKSKVKLLSELYLKSGDIESAIKLLKKFLKDNPDNVIALKQLAAVYKQAQRPHDYLHTLRKLADISPTIEFYLELIKLYNYQSMYDEQIEVLYTLIERFEPTKKEYLDLTYLLAMQRKYLEAVKVLESAIKKSPELFDIESKVLLIHLSCDAKKPEKAVKVSRELLGESPEPELLRRFGEVIHHKGYSKHALGLFNSYRKILLAHSPMLNLYLQIIQMTYSPAEEWKELHTLFQEQKLPKNYHERYIYLALKEGQYQALFQVTNTFPKYQKQFEVSLMQLLESRDQVKYNTIKAWFKSLPEDDQSTFPILALSLAKDQKNQKKWTERALKQESDSASWKIYLVKQLVFLKKHKEAVQVLEQLPSLTSLHSNLHYLVAQAYVQAKKIKGGFLKFKELKLPLEDPSFMGFALLALHHKRESYILSAIKKRDLSKVDPSILSDLYYNAMNNKRFSTAIYLAENLTKFHPSNDNQIRLARAYIEKKVPLKALAALDKIPSPHKEKEELELWLLESSVKKYPKLRLSLIKKLLQRLPLEQNTLVQKQLVYNLFALKAHRYLAKPLEALYKKKPDEFRELYLQLLREQSKKSRGKKKELIRQLLSHLQVTSDPKIQKQLVYELTTLKAHKQLAPLLAKMARNQPKLWLSSYVKVLPKGIKADKINQIIKSALAHPSPPDDQQLSTLAYYFIQKNYPTVSSQLLFHLCKDKGPEDEDLKQLLYVLGPRPPVWFVKWLKSRTENSTKDQLPKWFELLHLYGGGQVALSVWQQKPDYSLASTVLKIHDDTSSKSVTKKFINELWSHLKTKEDIQEIINFALQKGWRAETAEGYKKLVKLAPSHTEALAYLARYYFDEKDYDKASSYIEPMIAKNHKNYQFYLMQAEIHQSQKNKEKATSYFKKALTKLEAQGKLSKGHQIDRAYLLYRSDRMEESLEQYKVLYLNNPKDEQIKMLFFEMLLEAKQFDKIKEYGLQ